LGLEGKGEQIVEGLQELSLMLHFKEAESKKPCLNETRHNRVEAWIQQFTNYIRRNMSLDPKLALRVIFGRRVHGRQRLLGLVVLRQRVGENGLVWSGLKAGWPLLNRALGFEVVSQQGQSELERAKHI